MGVNCFKLTELGLWSIHTYQRHLKGCFYSLFSDIEHGLKQLAWSNFLVVLQHIDLVSRKYCKFYLPITYTSDNSRLWMLTRLKKNSSSHKETV